MKFILWTPINFICQLIMPKKKIINPLQTTTSASATSTSHKKKHTPSDSTASNVQHTVRENIKCEYEQEKYIRLNPKSKLKNETKTETKTKTKTKTETETETDMLDIKDFMSDETEYNNFMFYCNYTDEIINKSNALNFNIENLQEQILYYKIQLLNLQNKINIIQNKCDLNMKIYLDALSFSSIDQSIQIDCAMLKEINSLEKYKPIMECHFMLYKYNREKSDIADKIGGLEADLQYYNKKLCYFWNKSHNDLIVKQRMEKEKEYIATMNDIIPNVACSFRCTCSNKLCICC